MAMPISGFLIKPSDPCYLPLLYNLKFDKLNNRTSFYLYLLMLINCHITALKCVFKVVSVKSRAKILNSSEHKLECIILLLNKIVSKKYCFKF